MVLEMLFLGQQATGIAATGVDGQQQGTGGLAVLTDDLGVLGSLRTSGMTEKTVAIAT